MGSPQVFISYSHQDRYFAAEVATFLEGVGLRVWIDYSRLDVGAALAEGLDDAIGASTAVLVLVSSASVDSAWVQREIEVSVERLGNSDLRFVVPLVLDRTELHGALSRFLGIDVADRTVLTREMGRLLERLGVRPEVFEPQLRRLTEVFWVKEPEADFAVTPLRLDARKKRSLLDRLLRRKHEPPLFCGWEDDERLVGPSWTCHYPLQLEPSGVAFLPAVLFGRWSDQALRAARVWSSRAFDGYYRWYVGYGNAHLVVFCGRRGEGSTAGVLRVTARVHAFLYRLTALAARWPYPACERRSLDLPMDTGCAEIDSLVSYSDRDDYLSFKVHDQPWDLAAGGGVTKWHHGWGYHDELIQELPHGAPGVFREHSTPASLAAGITRLETYRG